MTEISDQPGVPEPSDLLPVTIEEEMRSSYLAYAMSVIVSRALPDVRDGLKPVHRRILYAMHESGFTYDKPYRKSARAVGEVMGKYHPHGDSSIYDAMVRMAQSWSMRVKLIDGQGNFGSVDGDSPAAMRYTEARLAKASTFLLNDIDRDTVDFQPNYDESEEEPTVLPATFPNLLINGATGIAVGMATNIPTHNPSEVIDATLALIANPDLSLDDLMEYVPGPDFPTGGIILGRSGIRSAFATGRGAVIIRAKADIEEIRKDRKAIIVTEIPYQVNKATLQERIADLVRNKQIEGIADIRDESDRSGMRVVIEIKRDATPEVVLNQLYRFTQLQTSFGVNMLALDGGKPRLMGLKDVLEAFIAFREEVILRRSRFELNKARDRGHILVGLVIAVANIDAVIALIRGAPDAAAAREALMAAQWNAADVEPLLALIHDDGNVVVDGKVRLTEAQARGILELRLQRLTGLERDKIQQELSEVAQRINELLEIIGSHVRRMEVLRDELSVARAEIATPRMTEIADYAGDQDDESLIEPGQMVVTITREGFIKRTPLDVFRAQNRGGRGRTGASTRGDDIVVRSFNAHTHQWVMFFSSGGKVYRQKVWRLPEAGPAAKGRALVNLLPDLGSDSITAVLPLPQDEELWEALHLVFATASGNVRRNRLSDFRNIRSSGMIAMKLDEGDSLIGVATCREGQDVFLATRGARCIRFQITDDTLRVFAGRGSSGVRGIRLAEGDRVISLAVLNHVEATVEERSAYLRMANAKRRAENAAEAAEEDADTVQVDSDEEEGSNTDALLSPERFAQLEEAEEILLIVSDGGFGRRSSAYDYRVSGRGGQGITNMTFSANKRGKEVAATLPVLEGTDVMLVTDAGRLIRVPVDQVRVMARQASGVTLFRLNDDERVTSVFPVMDDGEDEAGEAEGE
ncbi:DNA gyrase subunit A [Acetobacter pasteurianus]|uniref:DNA gyrase subunit A n=3 Tax=Acetobacter pasteurianus TaxID=438 RepID=C7JFW8_ACEP3|nr:DNA gyrase subunit A [Acetobacter pasteurianus]CCT59329.1 DNA gyrase subunit A [Acetobacter pasteurianus 386B]BAI00538.1 DNA gyrase subunit A [Acetobacter pasteurianus IFO 3283-01]BAI03589.1 DNA gyrase subunit A [Acetobacter pasteurianus IFO 3283-03]BAI06634.1 DNA gyrase subunit A [Acetobacter pasteurianus IFO 3283-07]BAI09684.1 DNA gyrase subunit A [Acetobacter pasteurianus IFO 3283-22]